MRMLKTDKIVNEINMIIKKINKENGLDNTVYISKNNEDKILEFAVYTQVLVKKDFSLSLILRTEEEGTIYKKIIDNFTLSKDGFSITDNSQGEIKGFGEITQNKITYQVNHQMNIKINFLLKEGLYELSFIMETDDGEKVLSVCPFEVKIK